MPDELLDRFLRYVRLDTQSDEHSSSVPSTEKQRVLSRLLAEECEALGLDDVVVHAAGYVTATLPGNVGHRAPAICWLAHIDTSPEFSGANVNPQVHENYDGEDLVLLGNPNRVVTVEDNPVLRELIGGTIITTDGTTLLGADDKAGIAVIMTAVAELLANPEIPRGPIRLCFPCDEEIGRGVDPINVEELDCVCGYTLDGDGRGKVDVETFSADQARIVVDGVNIHPSIGKGRMVNAVRILGEFISRLPTDEHAPEVTEDRQGFLHPYQISGGVASAEARILLRSFEDEELEQYAKTLKELAKAVESVYPGCTIEVLVRPQYRNLRDGLRREPRALEKAFAAYRATGFEPLPCIIRGGTDGSLLTAAGLPTPNLSCGQHNPHSPLEWTSVEEMQAAVNVLIELARLWSKETL